MREYTAKLEFRFNEIGESTGVYSPAQFGRFDGQYWRVPWKGYFRKCLLRDSMRIPCYGEAAWYEGEALQLVWKGRLIEAENWFEYERALTGTPA